MTTYFVQAFIYLCAAVIMVPLAKRLGLGSVLGYLIAGVLIGPVVGLVGDETQTLQHFAEFGVVMMLFLVGLELEPRMLWSMRNRLLGLGGLQVGLTAAAGLGVLVALGLDWRLALAIGIILSLSSTAIVLQTLQEKGLTKTDAGAVLYHRRRRDRPIGAGRQPATGVRRRPQSDGRQGGDRVLGGAPLRPRRQRSLAVGAGAGPGG